MRNRDTWRLGRRPALDGLRGIAVLLVVLSHAGVPGFQAAGVVGVTMFFTLSGFLITSLLLHEYSDTRRVRLGAFYIRRARRLLPALVVNVLGVALAALVIGPWFFNWRSGLAALAYVANWVQVHTYLG